MVEAVYGLSLVDFAVNQMCLHSYCLVVIPLFFTPFVPLLFSLRNPALLWCDGVYIKHPCCTQTQSWTLAVCLFIQSSLNELHVHVTSHLTLHFLSSRPTKCEVESEPRSSALLWCDGVYIKQHLSGLLFGNGYLFCALKHNQTFMLYFSHSQAFSLSHSFPTCPSAATVFNINHSHPAFYSWQTETISHIFYPPW